MGASRRARRAGIARNLPRHRPQGSAVRAKYIAAASRGSATRRGSDARRHALIETRRARIETHQSQHDSRAPQGAGAGRAQRARHRSQSAATALRQARRKSERIARAANWS
jgi:hypothetical protein